jgi:hypothetical protein
MRRHTSWVNGPRSSSVTAAQVRSSAFRELCKLTVDAPKYGSYDDISVEQENQLAGLDWQPQNVLDFIVERQHVVPQQKDTSRH